MAWQLVVVDGADRGRFFPLSGPGPITVGNSHRHADICLHDLYVARVHCQLSLEDGKVVVNDLEQSKGTFVNGQKVTRHELQPGEILRVGNSHLRLEDARDDGAAEPDAEEGAPAPARGPGRLPVLPAERLAELSGHDLGHFELGLVLGRGHHGVVFQARDHENDRDVALKVLAAEFPVCDAEMQTFARALRVLLPLRHPNLVAVYGAGKTGPYCWIARELIDGDSVRRLVEQAGWLGWKQTLRVAVHVGRALDFLHGRRLVHGNLTPHNVLVGKDKQVRLGDLLLSQALAGSRWQLARLEAKLLAELPYLAPEQTPGDAVVDCCTDIHGLGAVLYTMLTGQPPFAGDSPAEILEQVREATPVRPRESHESIPDELDFAVMKMLAKRPEDRYLTPGELLAELEPFARDRGVKV